MVDFLYYGFLQSELDLPWVVLLLISATKFFPLSCPASLQWIESTSYSLQFSCLMETYQLLPSSSLLFWRRAALWSFA